MARARLMEWSALSEYIRQRALAAGQANVDYSTVLDVLEWIADAPTIPAIPMDWLRDRMLEGDPEESKAAWRVKKMWDKEGHHGQGT